MSIYMMPVEVNSRKFISLQFHKEDIKEQRFVCEIPTMGVLRLLSFLEKGQASSGECMEHDKQVSLYSIEQPNKDEDKYVLHFYPNNDPIANKKEFTNTTNNILIQKDDDRYHLNFNYQQENKIVSILCQLHIGQQVWLSILTFELILRKNMFQAALDFGSEASQGILKAADERGESLNFIDLAKKYLYTKYSEHVNNDFHQYQEDNENNSNLFRSLFYLKDKRPLFLSLQAEDNLLRREGQQLPNIKIGLLDSKGTNIIHYHSNIVLNFIKSICYHIAKSIDNENEIQNNTFGLQLELLVPNVMSMLQIRNMVTAIQTKFDSYMDDPILGQFRLEINTFSESDASFLGYFKNQDTNRLVINKPYLIIDGGNGTMDFSIISIKNKAEYRSLYRDGFIGSGNAITYALFDHICAVITGFMNNKDRKELMTSLLFGDQTDQLGLRNLRNELEKIKKADKNPLKANRNCQLLKEKFGSHWREINLETLTTFLHDNTGDYGDCYGIIHATCDKICRLLTDNLLRNRITSNCMPSNNNIIKNPAAKFEEVILAGRAFRYPMLKKTLQNYMKKYFGITEDKIQFHSKSAKVSCLYGLFQFKMVNGNCGLSGIPSVGEILVMEDHSMSSQSKKADLWLDNILDKWLSDANRQADRSKPVESFEVNEKFLNEGCNIQIKSNEVLYMNGHEIQTATPLGKNINKDKDQEFNLYYDGTELLLRTSYNVSHLIRVAARIPIESSLMYESRFPNFNYQDKNDLKYFYFPELVNTK